MSTQHIPTDPTDSTDSPSATDEDDTRLIPLQPRHGPQPKRLV